MRCLLTLLVLSIVACSETTPSSPVGAGSDTVAPVTDFLGGEFQLAVSRVDDGCLDGGLALVFMPEGTGSPYALKHPTVFPALSELPTQVTMRLDAPFSDMTLPMAAGGVGRITVRGASQKGVLLGIAGTADCRADMVIDADVTVRAADRLDLSVTVVLDGLRSPQDLCPTMQSVPCTVHLEMSGQRR